MLSREFRTDNQGGKEIMSMNEMIILSGALAIIIVMLGIIINKTRESNHYYEEGITNVYDRIQRIDSTIFKLDGILNNIEVKLAMINARTAEIAGQTDLGIQEIKWLLVKKKLAIKKKK
jgi:hypothetical protein